MELNKWNAERGQSLSWLCSGGGIKGFLKKIYPPFLLSGSSIQDSRNKESVRFEKAVLNPGLQEMLIPIFYRRGFLWAAGAAVVPFKAHRMGLHAWSPNVRFNTKPNISSNKKRKKKTHTRHTLVFLLIYQESVSICFNYMLCRFFNAPEGAILQQSLKSLGMN